MNIRGSCWRYQVSTCIRLYLLVASAASQRKSRRFQSWNSVSECDYAVWKQVGARSRFTKFPTLLFNKMCWFGKLRAWSSENLMAVQTWWVFGYMHVCTRTHAHTHIHTRAHHADGCLPHVPKCEYTEKFSLPPPSWIMCLYYCGSWVA